MGWHDVVVEDSEYDNVAQAAIEVCSKMDEIFHEYRESLQRVCNVVSGDASIAFVGMLTNTEPLDNELGLLADENKLALQHFVEEVDDTDKDLY